jgi:nucleotide-binding universal stress UspA family protein
MDSDSILTIANHTYSRALLLKGRLEMEGIDCFLTNVGGIQGVDVRIREVDAERAYPILREIQKATGVKKAITVKTLRSVRRILVPIDFSQLSINAAHYALSLAQTLKADIRLLHVWFSNAGEPFALNEVYAYQVNFEGILQEQEQEARKRCEELAQALKQRIKAEKIKGVDIDFDLIRGSTVDSILLVAEEYKPGMLVMGTRGRNRESRSLMGSTTARIIENSPVPVMAVPADYRATHFDRPNNILYATNFDVSDFSALHRLIAFVRPFNVKIYCVHVNLKDSLTLDAMRMKQMREHFNKEYGEYDIECGLIESDDLLQGIQDFIHAKKIDVIAIGARKRNLLSQLLRPSMTRKILFQTEIPLFVFREALG